MKMKCRLVIALILSAGLACSQKKEQRADSNIFLQGKKLAEVSSNKILEISGLAESVSNPGLFWIHNDSGNAPEVFLVDRDLNIRLTCIVEGVQNRDWEDITVGPGPEEGKTYIYLGEIGDNFAQFPYKNIYRFEEPVLKKDVQSLTIIAFDRITFRLPDAQKDTESLMIDPVSKSIFIISKRESPVYLYELKYPQSTTDTLTANKLMPIPYTQIVGADFSADGRELIMKNYVNVYYWKINGTITESLRQPPYIVEYESEPQGEAITFARDGSGFYTISEKPKDQQSFLYFYPRKK